ncbi:UDP-N-acetylmuramoyl-tripeptide--D-alanyl-D-alanine ligase [Sphingobacterium sp. HJSM2_6]|uniref:UDP-N-acetylmuramoyl-tripeptide--D-alanyl-D- alanine ligase n=1 Tax=Sphingobacterium sp. HJSM2_6 TaxID=3366264 RepID=UPI003BCAFDAF
MDIAKLYQIYLAHPTVCTDTRQISKDCIFFALHGETFDGNSFAENALSLGAAYVVIDNKAYHQDQAAYILVPDVLETLQQLAEYHRQQLHIPIIGVTGTNGKTTTKELLYSVLSQKYKCFATKGNLNNHIGVPLTLLSLTSDIELAIVEMGANHQQEIEFLCHIAHPTHGLITNVGKAHLEGFGSFEGVMKTKGELYDYLQNHQGKVFLQGDNEFLQSMSKDRALTDITYYGFSEHHDVQGGLIVADPFIKIYWKKAGLSEKQEVQTQLTGAYNLENILAAVAVGLHFGLTEAEINQGISSYQPKNNRSQITKTAHNTIIADYYNANASSMHAALENIAVIQAPNKAIILGDMFEMGDQSAIEHEKLVIKAKSLGLAQLLFVGKAFYALKDDEALFFENTADVKEYLLDQPLKDYLILLKASRGMAFERLLEVL